MRRVFSILLVVLISIVLIVSCDADKAGNGGGSKPDSPSSVNMTDSYKTGRENFHFVTGVWLPELESVELLGSSDFSTEFGTFAEACFDILGDKTRYDSIANYLEGVLGNPVNKEADTQAWSLARAVDGKRTGNGEAESLAAFAAGMVVGGRAALLRSAAAAAGRVGNAGVAGTALVTEEFGGKEARHGGADGPPRRLSPCRDLWTASRA